MSVQPNDILPAIAIGIGATLVMDLWNQFLKRTFGIPSLNYCLLGRWIRHLAGGTLRHESIAAASPKPLECPLGWMAHYMIGIGFALVFVAWMSSGWLARPTLLPALLFGIATVVFPFFIMQPSFGLGVASSKTPNPGQARLKSLATHSVFGVGLYVSALGVSNLLHPSHRTQSSAPQPPAGLAAAALADPSFRWIRREAPGFRVYFLADSYPAAHQDSLLARLPPALDHARSFIAAPALQGPIDLFFIESRAQMTALIGGRATGFAQPSTRTVLLVTNPEWRAFERHEIMHVVLEQTWGPPARDTAWLQEGLAQAADGLCAGYSNTDVLLALTRRHGWIPLDAVLTKFREQPDVRAYLQAAGFTDYLLRRYGPRPLEHLWRGGAKLDSPVSGEALSLHEQRWKAQLSPQQQVGANTLAAVESKGCG